MLVFPKLCAMKWWYMLYFKKYYEYDIVSRNVTSNKSANVTSTASINSDGEKVRYEIYCYILHTILLVIILLFMILLLLFSLLLFAIILQNVGQNRKVLMHK